MNANLLTPDLAKKANITIITDGKGTQAVHDVIVAMRANRRSGTACVKTKATVNLSGKKPWRQKGTGRARAGYASSPVWVGGGVSHGPHPRSYAKNTTKAVKKLAFRKALSSRILAGDIFLVESFEVAEPKTKHFLDLLTKIHGGNVSTLVVSTSFPENTFLSARNVQRTLLMSSAEVNTENFLAFDKIIITQEALSALGQRLSS
ncbi:MAG: 50S ribosomal protein L4 [Verrucomicrobia bacterium RIFCSPHIGHO2_12_FULL_41_10]|nr:MAG: 50S ribosomal protein L4 [Verrucomicrobia bacterium RIFCSPHIGHO2_12_FULL_41_10]HLB32817.1 50S ribosomal protein L4 [Chthoniobacterales bacterium]